MTESDLDLVHAYARQGSEEAFAALVQRHLNLVYSAALRQVRSPELAEEVAQSVFTELSRNVRKLKPDTILTAWLYQVTRRTAIDVVRRESRRQLREQIAMEMADMTANSSEWLQIESFLDEAMEALDETDRAAILLRYFENKSLREVGQSMGTSDDAAQKRVSRAVERLREFFTKRGITVGAGGLVAALSANTIQAAPVGLAITISSAATLAGAAVQTSAAIATTKAIAMTTMQKTLVALTLAAAVGTGTYQVHQNSLLRDEVHAVRQEQLPLTKQLQQLEHYRDEAAIRLAALQQENDLLHREAAEMPRLRGELALLRNNQSARKGPSNTASSQIEGAEIHEPAPEEIGRELGMAVVRGEPGALDKLSELAKAALANFNRNSVGLNETLKSELGNRTFAPLWAAFQVIGDAAASGNPVAVDAVVRAMERRELQGHAVKSMGKLAGMGNEDALELLLNHEEYGFLLSTTVGALRPAAENGNQRAIDALSAVAGNPKNKALWYMAAQGLEKPAEAGNSVAIDALIGMSASTNINVRRVVASGLRKAGANQNPKAAEALRSMDIE